MNARHPVLSLFTADPVADAARYEDAREAEDAAYEAMLAEAEQQAPLIVLAQLQAIKQPGAWFAPYLCAGVPRSADEILCDAIEENDEAKNAFAELMVSPAAQQLRQAMAEFIGRKYAMDIYTETHH